MLAATTVMDIELEPGKYVVAVSGGVDSVTLLYLLSKMRSDVRESYSFVVAHFDHGIRDDSELDRRLVQKLADEHGMPFVYELGNLGPDASEALARKARYEFLRKVRSTSGAQAIITAHHQDDLLETAILNILRGTGRKGLTSLADRPDIRRPMLHIPKQELVRYAETNELIWREDSTNSDEKYTRNYVRLHIMPKLDEVSRSKLLDIIKAMRGLNNEIDSRLINLLHTQDTIEQVRKPDIVKLSHAEAKELLATWLRLNGIKDFDTKTLDRLVTAAKTKRAGAKIDIINNRSVVLNRSHLALVRLDC